MKSAIIGLGVVGNVHLKVLSAQGKEIAALCDIDTEAAKKARDTYSPNAKIYTDWKLMIDEISPDVVHICTPHYLHGEMVIYSLNKNINVLCEKPLCMKKDELSTVLAAEENSSARLGVCLQNRYNPANIFAKEYLKDKEIVSANGIMTWHRDEKYYASGPWRGKLDTEGGGVLINQALHTLDLLQWFCSEPQYVAACENNFTLTDIIEVEDTLSAVFFGKNTFSLFASNASASDMPVCINIKTADGDILTLLPRSASVNGETVINEKEPGFIAKSCYGRGHEGLIADFYDHIKEGKDFPINGKEASKVMRLIFAAYESRGKKIKI
ncbi:MAG: Gfo/Idh/MocA family oxidoreductase [Ruminococcaceae bacterium]|nr:Gfo/Idh/MocA family oxidoreductase [Oscillospiraceae bacterium]